MSIRNKLYMSFGTMILLLLIISSIAYYQLNHIDKLNHDLFDNRVYKLLQIDKILSASALQGSYLRSYILEPNEATYKKLEEQENIIQTKVAELDSLFTSENTQRQMEIIKTKQALFEKAALEIINTYDSNNLQSAIDILRTTARPASEAIQQAVHEIAVYEEEQIQLARAKSSQVEDISSFIILVLAAISTFLSFIIVFLMTRAITIPVNKLATAANIIATGDLRQEDVTVKTKDEIGTLADSFNTMKTNLHTLIDNVVTNVKHTTSSSEELAASTDEVSQASKDIAKRIEIMEKDGNQAVVTGQETAMAMDETARGVQRIAEATQTLHVKALDTQNVANEGDKMLQTTENQMMIIQQSSHDTNRLIQQLSAQSTEIENITKTITDITDQTNLLALNATIEAVRAGEHGQGFTVVADEVRKLAEESKISANQIIHLITQIQQNTVEVEKAVSITVHNIDEGVAYIQKAQTAFHNILSAIGSMASDIEDVSASTQQISASTEEVAASVNEMSSVAKNVAEQSKSMAKSLKEQAATIQETHSVAKSLSDGATTLQEEISKFKV
ncbi:methyl-accepting chemotaxis protein [Lysinibacillus sp. NPDC097195]|uniref:methyl-accepting chemotaxis protein n=1 Tax=Lysinibacillus sp. NPDC097195 TaxID=3364141 RepID=UPI003830DE0F